MITSFSGETEAKLADLTSIRQNRDKSVLDYFQRFKAVKFEVLICRFLGKTGFGLQWFAYLLERKA